MDNIKAWLCWSVAAFFVFYQFLLQISTSVMIPELMHDFSISVVSVSILSASFFYTYILLQIPAGFIVDRYGARKVLVISMASCALASALFAMANSMFVAELARMLMGMFSATSCVAAMFLAANLFPLHRFALFAGLTEMLGMLGGALGQNILAFLVIRLGWRNSMLVCALVGVVLMLLTVIFVYDGPLKKTNISKRRDLLKEFKQIFYLPEVWFNGLYGGMIFAVISAFASLWAIPYLMQLYNIGLSKAAAASSMMFWGAALGGFVMGLLCACDARRKTIMRWNVIALFITLALLIYVPKLSLSIMFGGLFFAGFFSGAYVLMFATVCDIVPCHLRGIALGFTNMLAILFGAPILQPIIGLLLKLQTTHAYKQADMFSIHNYQIAFLPMFVGLLIAFISLYYIHDQKKCNNKK